MYILGLEPLTLAYPLDPSCLGSSTTGSAGFDLDRAPCSLGPGEPEAMAAMAHLVR